MKNQIKNTFKKLNKILAYVDGHIISLCFTSTETFICYMAGKHAVKLAWLKGEEGVKFIAACAKIKSKKELGNILLNKLNELNKRVD